MARVMVIKVPHPIPYQGSKRRIADTILAYVPLSARFVEPFAGSAAMSLAVATHNRSDRFLLNDINDPLIGLWRLILEQPISLADSYADLWGNQIGQEVLHYNCVRSTFNVNQDPRLFLFLLARCVKGAVRYNTKGEFNQSPDNRRRGRKPHTMREHIRMASELFANRTLLKSEDYRSILELVDSDDMIYLDPPYQGVSRNGSSRYCASLELDDFVESLDYLNSRGLRYIVSYDGRTGQKRHGSLLPDGLGLTHVSIDAGPSAQATLNGYRARTIESLYISPSLAKRSDFKREMTLF